MTRLLASDEKAGTFRDDEQYQKEVAIKLVRGGTGPALVLERFKAERQILANLEHPNIARLIGGGTTEEGWPYFSMEFVEGEPIDQYCASCDLSTVERLELFRTVCAASFGPPTGNSASIAKRP